MRAIIDWLFRRKDLSAEAQREVQRMILQAHSEGFKLGLINATRVVLASNITDISGVGRVELVGEILEAKP